METREIQLETVAGLESVIADLRDVCLHEKHIDPDNDDRVNYVIKDLEDQIQDLRQRVFTSDETKWKVEMAKGKVLAQQDKLFLSFNRALVEVGEGTRLEPSTHGPQDVRQFLHNLNSQLKAADRNLHTQTEGLNRELKADTKDIQSLMCERDRVKLDLGTKSRELNELLADKEDGQVMLHQEKEDLHAAVIAIQDEGEKDLEKLDKELERVKRDLADKHKQFDKEKKTLKELLEKTAEALTLKRKKQMKILDDHLAEYQRQADEKIKSIEHQTEQIKGISKILPVPK